MLGVSRVLYLGLFCHILLGVSVVTVRAEAPSGPTTSKIIGGKYYDLSKSSAALIWVGMGWCSGLLVGPQTILTAAHCVAVDASVDAMLVAVGGELHTVEDGFYLRNYDPDGSAELANSRYDIGFLILSSKVTSVYPTPILYDYPIRSGDLYTIAGFGTNESVGSSNIASKYNNEGKAAVIVVDQVLDGMFSSHLYTSGAGTCHGDSGGPVIFTIDEYSGVVGLISTGTTVVDNRSGTCRATGNDSSNYVDLQSSHVSNSLLAIPGVNFLSGSLVLFFHEIRGLSRLAKKVIRAKSLPAITQGMNSLRKKLLKLRPLADHGRLDLLNKAAQIARSAAKSKTLSKGRKQVRMFKVYLDQLVDMKVSRNPGIAHTPTPTYSNTPTPTPTPPVGNQEYYVFVVSPCGALFIGSPGELTGRTSGSFTGCGTGTNLVTYAPISGKSFTREGAQWAFCSLVKAKGWWNLGACQRVYCLVDGVCSIVDSAKEPYWGCEPSLQAAAQAYCPELAF